MGDGLMGDGLGMDWGLVIQEWRLNKAGGRGDKMMVVLDGNHNKMMVIDVDLTASPQPHIDKQ